MDVSAPAQDKEGTFSIPGRLAAACRGVPERAAWLARCYATVIKAADVRPIKFHGLRHTCATLLLQAGVPVKVVSERLGHTKVSMTLDVYAHVLPEMQRDAAALLGGLLHGR